MCVCVGRVCGILIVGEVGEAGMVGMVGKKWRTFPDFIFKCVCVRLWAMRRQDLGRE